MNYRLLFSLAVAAAIAFAQPISYLAQEANKAAGIIAAARKAIGGGKLDTLKTFSVEAAVERNMGNMQLSSDVEIVLDLPDKYLKTEAPNGGGGMMVQMAGGGVSGFNGDRSLQKIQNASMAAGGGMMIRMGGAPGAEVPAEKPTPEQVEQMTRLMMRNSRIEASRLMLGWFANAHPSANATYSYLGEAESAEGTAHVIEVRNSDGLTARLFIDRQTSLPLMVTYQGPAPRLITQPMGAAPAGGDAHAVTLQRPASEEERKKMQADVQKQVQQAQQQAPELVDYALYFEEWREADGIRFPFKIRRARAGTTNEEWTIRKVKVNPRVDPKRFAGES
jgi:hypothetical protein